MKKGFCRFLICLSLSLTIHAARAGELDGNTLNDIFNKNPNFTQNKQNLVYTFLRCGAVYLSASNFLISVGQAPEMSSRVGAAAQQALVAAINATEPSDLDETQATFARLTAYYTEKGNEYARRGRGTFLDSPFLRSDIALCTNAQIGM